MIAVEMMARKIEEGFDKFRAATFAYTSTAFPMLTGTLITAAGFLPIATAKSTTGEYTFAIFAVVTLALLISWVAAVSAAPFIGNYLLKEQPGDGHEVFDTRFYRALRATDRALHAPSLADDPRDHRAVRARRHRHGADREAVLPELQPRRDPGRDVASRGREPRRATEEQARRMEALLAQDADIETYVAYVGNGSPRYYLSLDQQLFRPNFAQFVVLTKDVPGRDRAIRRLRAHLDEAFPASARGRSVRRSGPPVAYPIQFRVMGPDLAELKRIGEEVEALVRANPYTIDAHTDWGERSPAVRIDVDQDKARAIGLVERAGRARDRWRDRRRDDRHVARGRPADRCRAEGAGRGALPAVGSRRPPGADLARPRACRCRRSRGSPRSWKSRSSGGARACRP